MSWLKNGNISLIYLFLSGYSNNSYLILIFPIIVSIPFSTSYLTDLKTGTLKYIYIRMSKYKYIFIKIIVNGLVGGFVLLIGPLISFIFLLISQKFTGIPYIKEEMETIEYFNSIGIYSPINMILIIFVTLFFCGFIFSNIALAISVITRNIFLTILFPFVLHIASTLLFQNTHPNLTGQALFNVDHFGISFTHKIINAVILLSISTFIIYIGGLKVEQNNI
ncbi:hypothetical protein [Bacillus sp. PS06]|uniref:hypothetical protein n=1 Tax=Bacillus sp. PS06 TaxID=2764176 RepID=UPI00177EFC67|nr:hypothetical protein [Bacillus sp. PS06]MBD8067355.1 hypothetical protein [Bacillus sp. PS06]